MDEWIESRFSSKHNTVALFIAQVVFINLTQYLYCDMFDTILQINKNQIRNAKIK
jgi:hypothetical protein